VKLLEPVTLGQVEAPNRLLFGPHVTNLGRGRSLSERHAAYYGRRAGGGAGVIVIETASVHESDWPYERAPLASACGPGWRAVAAAVRQEGAIGIASLGHAGMQGSSAYSQRELWAPSALAEPVSREVAKAMEVEDIADVVAGFAAATRLALGSGLDGVEVDAGAVSLVRQFLSGLTNLRDDAYGAERTRLALEVLGAVRDAAGGAVVGLRLSCDELAPWAGITPEGSLAILGALAPLVDYVVPVRGGLYAPAAARPDMHLPEGLNGELTRTVRSLLADTRAPAVVAQGSIVDAAAAASWLADGTADLLEMTRAQIADPELGRKLASGAAGRVRPCILCNQRCQVLDVRNPIVSCVVEPSAGHEAEDAPVPAARSRRVARQLLVVGGGPAGLEAARVAALHGLAVEVVERSDHLGGALVTAAAAPGRARLARLVEWLAAECEALGVTVRTGVEAGTAELDAHDGPLLLATGGRDGEPGFGVGPGAPVVTAAALLEAVRRGEAPGQAGSGGPVLVWDPVGGPVGASVAELLARSGRDALLATPDLVVGRDLSAAGDLVAANARLRQAGVELLKRTELRSVASGTAVLVDRFSGQERRVAVGLVVDAGHRLPEDGLWRERPGLLRAGDAVAPRTAYEAVLEGRRAAGALAAASGCAAPGGPGADRGRVA